MTERSGFRTRLLSATALLTLLAHPALAQEAEMVAAADAEADSETIIVTGTRRSLQLIDVPINIAATSGGELAKNRVDDVRALAAFTPGLTVLDTGPRNTGSIVLRGLSADDTTSTGANQDNAVATYMGEVPLYQDFKFLDIARVETLLGPQGTLYGAGTLAGAIRYIPNRPDPTGIEGDFRSRMYVVAEAKDPGFTLTGTINIPLIRDKVALRTTAGYYNDPGFIDYIYLLREPGVSLPQPGGAATSIFDPIGTPEEINANLFRSKDANSEDTFSIRNTIGIFPAEGINIYLSHNYQRTQTNGRQVNSAGIFGSGNYEATQRYLEPSDRKTHLLAAEIEVELGGFAQLVSATGWSDQQIDSSVDVTDLLLDLDYGYELFPQFSGFTRSNVNYETLTQEVRLVSKHGGPFSWVLGGFYSKQKFRSDYREVTPGLPEFYFGPVDFGPDYPEPIEYISYVRSEVVEKGLFGEASFQITPKWQVTGGLRYYKYDSEAVGAIALPLLEPVPKVVFGEPGGGTASADGVVWKLNTSYKFNENFLLYVTYSKGFRIGGPNRVAPCDDLGEQQSACALPDELFYGPDETKNIEVGLRARFFDGMLSTNLAVYHIDWEGIQLASQTVNGAVGITANGGSAVSKGLELSFNARPFPQLSITGSYAYNDAYLTEGVEGLLTVRNFPLNLRPKQVPVDVLSGDRLPGTPMHSGSIGVTFTQPLTDVSEIIANWTATYQGDVLTRVGGRAGGEKLPSYTLHRASLAYTLDRFSVRLYADNIFNKYAVTSVGNDRSRQIINSGVVSRYFAQSVASPRRVGIEFGMGF